MSQIDFFLISFVRPSENCWVKKVFCLPFFQKKMESLVKFDAKNGLFDASTTP